MERATPVTEPPAALLRSLGIDSPGLAAELDDAVANLAVAYRRRAGIDVEWRECAVRHRSPDAYGLAETSSTDARVVAFERLATEGHNLHPCGRTRLGWSPADVLAYDQEAPPFEVGFLAVRKDVHVGDDIGALLAAAYPEVPSAPHGYVVQPVHPWQRAAVLGDRYAGLFRDDALRDLPGGIAASSTTALRTVLLAPDRSGARRYLKLSLDIQVTSTRRSISIASTHNGPQLSTLLSRLLAGDDRVILMPEVAGAALHSGRDIAAILRGGLDAHMAVGEVAIPAAALPAMSPISGRTLLDEVVTRSGLAAVEFIVTYARLLLGPVLRLLDAGVGLEAHLQNCIPIFHDGVPVRMAFRDFAGLRLHLPRISDRSSRPRLRLRPGSVTAGEDMHVVRAKAGYTALQANLGELIARLVGTRGLDETEAWRAVRGVIDDIYATEHLDAADHAFFRAPTMPHKALVRMRLAGSGDIYVPVSNPMRDG